jgi:hypothetical protein
MAFNVLYTVRGMKRGRHNWSRWLSPALSIARCSCHSQVLNYRSGVDKWPVPIIPIDLCSWVGVGTDFACKNVRVCVTCVLRGIVCWLELDSRSFIRTKLHKTSGLLSRSTRLESQSWHWLKVFFYSAPTRKFWFFFLPIAQKSLVGQGVLIIEASQLHSDTPHSVGLLWMSG